MRGGLIISAVALLSIGMVAASLLWLVEAPFKWEAIAAASFIIALCSFFFNLSGAVYLTEGGKLEKNISKLKKKKPGKVAFALPVYEPDVETLRKSIRSLKEIEYPGQKEIVVLDDTEKPAHAKEVAQMVLEEKVILMHRKSREGGKAGALNEYIKTTDAEFLAIFDGDEIVYDKQFLMETMGHFEKKNVAFVQTNKRCGGTGLFEQAANYTNAAFVNLIQPINTKKGVGLFTGSCGVFRIEAIKSVGGFPNEIIEDVAVSLKLLWKGWSGEHVAKIYAEGAPVKKFNRFAEQHMRYISGITALLPEYAKNIWRYPIEKKGIMLVHALGLHYVSIVQIGACLIAVVSAWWGLWLGEIASLAYLISTLASLLILSKVYVGSFRVGFVAYILNFSVVIPRLLAVIATIFGVRRCGEKMILFAALLQLASGLFFFWISITRGSIAMAWWGVLFISNPLLLMLKK